MLLRSVWKEVPEGYDFIAQDEDGSVWAYKTKPILNARSWVLNNNEKQFIIQLAYYNIPKWYVGDWECSLIERDNL